MGLHSSQIVEVINRNVVVTLALNQGFNAFLPVYDDGIDFILYRRADDVTRKVQLKSRWTIDRKYQGRDIWIAFPARGDWYLAPHDEMVANAPPGVLRSQSWRKGAYSTVAPSAETLAWCARYRLSAIEAVAEEAAETVDERPEASDDRTPAAGVLSDLRDFRRQRGRQVLTTEDILSMRDEGRS